MKLKSIIFVLISSLLLTACGKKEEIKSEEADAETLFPITLQTDWYAQPEHGGFYQALANGYYEEEGLDVTILPGGPNAITSQKLAQGVAQFGIGRSDEVLIGNERGIPLIMVGALMQKDPQAIMFHQEHALESLADLNGKGIMAGPGSAMIEIIKETFDIEFSVIPLDYGINRFLNDKEFIQQCFITNEPYYAAREGADVGTILVSESGFKPYRVWFSTRTFLRKHPDIVQAFHRASVRGWQSYLTGDRSEANRIIASLNPKMDEDFMSYVHQSMVKHELVTGDGGDLNQVGTIDPARIETEIRQLRKIGMLESPRTADEVIAAGYLKDHPGIATKANLPVHYSGDKVATIYGYELDSLPWSTAEVELDTTGIPTKVRGVYLRQILPLLPADADWDLLTALCSDAYQSNFDQTVLTENDPFLILEIDGKPTADWCSAKGHPEWGPFMIHTLKEDGLLDPVNKNPWGVVSLSLMKRDIEISSVKAKIAPSSYHGLEIYLGNCVNCHNIDGSLLGGTVSTRNLTLISTLATHSRDYFLSVLKDPVGTNPLAEKMPAVTHYSEDQINALVAFLTDYVE